MVAHVVLPRCRGRIAAPVISSRPSSPSRPSDSVVQSNTAHPRLETSHPAHMEPNLAGEPSGLSSVESGDLVNISCERCRKRKIKCDRQKPCSKCIRAKVQCSVSGSGERARPASRKHVQALENQVSHLEAFIKKLKVADDATRHVLLGTTPIDGDSPGQGSVNGAATVSAASPSSPAESGNLVIARAREGRLRKLTARKSTQFYGGTSLFQSIVSETPTAAATADARVPISGGDEFCLNRGTPLPPAAPSYFPFHAKDETCRQLMATFFKHVYQYNMCIYREWFLRDYAVEGGGPYYSDPLMYSICAVGATVSQDKSLRQLSGLFAARAEKLVLDSLELPDLTTLQALVLLGHREIGQGRGSKGWLYCGMAFRLTHEMGLHLDPDNWTSSKSDSPVDREILRRVYWAVFVADKQLSLYFGRPPALYPHEADVRNTIRIPYPPEWESLLDTYISRGTSSTAFEDSPAVVGAIVHQVELAKILHTMIVDVFENRRRHPRCPASAAATAQQVHTALVRWLGQLPQKLHWNQWTVGQVPPYVLHLHMLFHTAMIILHRPPRQHLDDEAVARGEGVEVCYQSLEAILRLLKSFGRYHRFETLPLDFVHTLSAAAECVMMRRYMEQSSWDDRDVARPLGQILDVMFTVQEIFPCMREIRDSILETIKEGGSGGAGGEQDQGGGGGTELDLINLLQSGAVPFPGAMWCPEEAGSVDSADLGFLVTEDFLNEQFSWQAGDMPMG
ncbi:fungal-specific transcription factor domain-containing protein [Plectosphaerella plurivora]|uniref:Fungal-specific transcription factor domain-containing protein n=1 Tax=Plectosphaerella plurivora TaxID=936078 RepID=A0A9P8VAL4_9PEZI|nr:fungal-specific transcription factor domain-containing protein [Plectosphaerella plurivora]